MKRKSDASPDKAEQIPGKENDLDEKRTRVLDIFNYFENTSEADIISQLQNNNIDLNMFDDKNITLYMYSTNKGYFNLFKYLNSNPDTKKDITAKDQKTIIHFAAIGGNKDIFQSLLDNLLNIEVKDQHNNTPLHLASLNGHIAVIELLLQKGADIEAININGYTPLLVAAASGHIDAFKLFLEHGANIKAIKNHGKNLLHLAADHGQIEIIKFLPEHGTNIEILIKKRDINSETPLHLAVNNGHIEIVKLFLKMGADIEATTRDGNTPLHLAVINGHIEIVKLFLKMGTDIEATTRDGDTPLHLAVNYHQIAVIKLLLQKDANIEATDKNGNTPLLLAAGNGYIKAVKLLLQQGASITACSKSGNTALHRAAENGHIEVVKFLLEQNVDIEAKDNYGHTSLGLAGFKRNKVMTELLINNGAKTTNLLNRRFFSSEMVRAKVDTSKFLFKLGIPIAEDLDTLNLHYANIAQELKDIVSDLFLVEGIKDQAIGLPAAPNACQDLIAKRLERLLIQDGLRSDYTNYKEYIENIDEATLNLEIKQSIINFITKHQERLSIFATALLTDYLNEEILPLELYATCGEKSKVFYLTLSEELGIKEVNNLFDKEMLKHLRKTDIQEIIDNFNVQVINKYFSHYINKFGIDDNSSAITQLILPRNIKNDITYCIEKYNQSIELSSTSDLKEIKTNSSNTKNKM